MRDPERVDAMIQRIRDEYGRQDEDEYESPSDEITALADFAQWLSSDDVADDLVLDYFGN